MKNWKPITAVSGLHFLISAVLIDCGYRLGALEAGGAGLQAMRVFFLPLITPLEFIPRLDQLQASILPGNWGFVLILLNSIVWGLASTGLTNGFTQRQDP